jgi:hypothetical protein
MVAEGKYKGSVLDYGIGLTKAGLPQVLMVVEFTDHLGAKHEMPWYGTLKQGPGKNITLQALKACGFPTEARDRLHELAAGVDSGLLDLTREVQVTIAHEQDDQGRPMARVRWINSPGGAIMSKKISVEEAAEAMKKIAAPQSSTVNDADVPF